MQDIPQFPTFAKVEPLLKGWSDDRKYFIETKTGEKLLLRLSDARLHDRKQQEYRLMQSIAACGVPMSQPLAFGLCEAGKSVFILLSWQEGEEAKEVIPRLTPAEQYRLGRQAGLYLRRMHNIAAPVGLEGWATRFDRKTRQKIEKYRACGIRFTGDQLVIDYLEKNSALLDGRPQTFQHGDYHVGNMIISPGGELSIIDFNRFDFGDPWEEFNRIVWCAANSPTFASGRIDGYFDGNIPALFFPLLAYYIASNTLSSIYWAIPFGEAEVATMLRQSAQVLEAFAGMHNPVPRWYQRIEKEVHAI